MIKKKISKNLSKFSKKELDSFFQGAKSLYKNQAFTILSNKSDLSFGKILIMVPKKYGSAPERNLIKRRLKSIFWEESLYEKLRNLVIMVRPHAKTYDFDSLKKLLLNHN